MRQVMPHRNNIVAECRRCKCFLRPVEEGPQIRSTVAFLSGPDDSDESANNIAISII
jgi:hypothetical protein